MDFIGSEGFVRSSHCRQPRGKIHRIACDGVFLALATARFARDYLAGGEPDMDLQGSPSFLAENLNRGMNGECGAHRPFWIIAVGGRRTEYRHHAIADVLVYRAAIAHDDIIDDFKIGVEKTMRLLWIEGTTEAGEARQVGKEDCDLPPVTQHRAATYVRRGEGKL